MVARCVYSAERRPLPVYVVLYCLGRLHGVCTVLNAAPALPDLDPEILENTDILVLNQTEAEIISGISGKRDLTKSLFKKNSSHCRN